MSTVRKEIRDLVAINETNSSALLSGDHIADDEATLIRQCARELLGRSRHRSSERRSERQ